MAIYLVARKPENRVLNSEWNYFTITICTVALRSTQPSTTDKFQDLSGDIEGSLVKLKNEQSNCLKDGCHNLP